MNLKEACCDEHDNLALEQESSNDTLSTTSTGDEKEGKAQNKIIDSDVEWVFVDE